MGDRYAALFACLTAVLLSACSSLSLHPYSPERDQQGKKAKETYAKLDTGAPLAITRKNIKTWLDEQTAVEDELWAGYRNARAQSIAYGWTLTKYRDEIEKRFIVLAGEVKPEDRKRDRQNLDFAIESLASIGATNRMVGQPAPDCAALLKVGGLDAAKMAVEELSKTNQDAAAAVAANLNVAKDRCEVIQRITANPKDGELAAALALLHASELEITTDETFARALKAAYEAQTKVYAESVQTLLSNPEDKTAKSKIDEAAKKLGGLVTTITQAQDAFSMEFVTKERLASLNGLLKTYADIGAGKEVKDGNKVAIALTVFPDIRDKARNALSDANKPHLLPLAIQKNVELAKLETADKVIALRRQVLNERKAQVASIESQLDALTQAREAFLLYEGAGVTPTKNNPAIDSLMSQTLFDVMEGGDATAPFVVRQKLWASTALFLDAEGRLRAEAGKTYYRISALEHEQALTHVESGLKQWKSLLDPSVELTAMYAGSGIKTAEFISLFNSIALFWIAAAV